MDTLEERILIVEDSPVNQRLLFSLLARSGYQVDLAGNGVQALNFLEDENRPLPNLIVLDILMPEMNGFELCLYLKQNPSLQDIPVIFISSLGEAADKVRGFEVGGVDYVTKPFHSGEVLARIHTHLKLCRLQRQLEEKNIQLNLEKEKSESLLLNVLPVRVAQELIAKGSFAPKSHREVTVCFADIVQFTRTASQLEPEVIIRELNNIFSAFDNISGRHGCERIKTIGDAYLCTSGIPDEDPHHVHKMADVALEMIAFLQQCNKTAAHKWQVRIGIHCGNVVGGIVGVDKYLFDIFGDTVNIASRLEGLSQPMQIHTSQEIYDKLKESFVFSEPSWVEMKGKGVCKTYFLEGRKKKCNCSQHHASSYKY